MSYALLGPVGELRPVPAPQSGVGVSAERARNEWQVLGGALVSQQSSRVHRTWAWSIPWKDPSVMDWFFELASGVVPGPHYLYTTKAEFENLAPPQIQTGGSGIVANRRVLAAGDPEVRTYIVPCRPNTQYTLSALGDGVGVVTITAAGKPRIGFGFGPFGSGPFGE